jgi:anti-sigma regulatory factor (Ser/Thr protein kinase)
VPGPVLVTQTTRLDPLMTTPSAQLAPVSGTDWPWLQSAVQMARISCRDWPSELGSRGNWTTPPKVATRKPAPAAASIGPSRAFALRTMHRWGEDDRADDVAAVVSELLANALRHALPQAGEDVRPWPIRLGLLHAGSHVVCAVADPGAGIPVLREPDCLEESGRGLLVVASLSDQWGYCPAPKGRGRGGDEGKVVWAAFAAARIF